MPFQYYFSRKQLHATPFSAKMGMILPRRMPSRLLVTGGCGFIGSNFIHHILNSFCNIEFDSCDDDHVLYSNNYQEMEIDLLNMDKLTYAADPDNLKIVSDYSGYFFEQCDISDYARVIEIFENFKPECVIHFAAESHVDRSIESGYEFMVSNVLGTHVLLEASRKVGVSLFIHISTDEVYGSTDHDSFSENSHLNPSSPYSSSKASSDLVALSHHNTYGTPVIVTRCTNNFGPRQHPEKLVPKVIQLASQDCKIPVYGSGMQVRDWLYVKDHCQAILDIILKGEVGQIYNIAGRNEINNLEMIDSILRRIGKSSELIEHTNDRQGHDFRYSVDDGKLRSLGWEPRISFEDGLDYTIEDTINRLGLGKK